VLSRARESGSHRLIMVDRKKGPGTSKYAVKSLTGRFRISCLIWSRCKNHVADRLRRVLGLRAKATFMEFGSIEHSAGKAKRVLDRREDTWRRPVAME